VFAAIVVSVFDAVAAFAIVAASWRCEALLQRSSSKFEMTNHAEVCREPHQESCGNASNNQPWNCGEGI